MPKPVRIFVACPGDVQDERKQVHVACEELNRTLGKFLDVTLEVLDWIQVAPGAGRPQNRILQSLRPEEWDIFIGVFWRRFGLPTGERNPATGTFYRSGTQQEFEIAYRRWVRHRRPHIMLYRCERLPKGLDGFKQSAYGKIGAFFAECGATRSHPCHYRSYQTVAEFERALRLDLAAILIERNEPLRRKLSAVVPRHFLQVLLTRFTLSHSRERQRLTIELDESLQLVTDSHERQDFHREVRSAQGGETAKRRLESRLQAIRDERSGEDVAVDCEDWPLRYANGGVLPIVRFKGRRHFILFYRETFPTGWNIANGGSDDYQEILHPDRVLVREFSEELLIADESREVLYCFDPRSGGFPLGYQSAAVRAWTRILGKKKYEDDHVLPMPLEPEGWLGPDVVEVRMKNDRNESGGYFLSITPEDNAIEVDRVAHIDLDLSEHHRLLDGEVTEGSALGRIVGLFDCEGLLTSEARRKGFLRELARAPGMQFRPDVYFSNGERGEATSLIKAVEEYRAGLRHRDLAPISARTRPRHPFPLCPITRSIVSRYLAGLG